MRLKLRIVPLNNSILDYIILVIGLLYLILFPSDLQSMPITGILLILLSIYMCVKTKNNKVLLMMMGMITLINVSLGYTDCILMGVNVSQWQSIALRSSTMNPVCAKSILLSMIILNMFIDKTIIRINKDINESRQSNSIISSVGILFLLLILVYAYISLDRLSGEYTSVSNPIYEYSLMIIFFVWFYSKGNRLVDYFIWIYVALFCLKFLGIGDRSSVIMMMILIAIFYFYKYIKIKNLLIVVLMGIPIVNLFGAIRNISSFSFSSVIVEVLKKGFYIDTVSYAYYSSIAVTSLYERVSSKWLMIFGFIKRCIGVDNEFGSLTAYARNNYSDLMNYDGGIYGAYFYAFGGYIGVIIGAVILGIIIRKIMLSKNEKYVPYQILLSIYAFRWYLYNPITLFRSVIIFGTILLLLCRFVDLLSKKV